MKMKYIFRASAVVLVLSLVACSESLEDINIDPNNSATANEKVILPTALTNVGYIVDADLNAASFLWAQYYTWGIGVSLGNPERFVAEPDDYDGYWQDAYADALIDLKFLAKSSNPAYRGVAKALQAYVFQGLTDHFGDIPFSESLSGEIADGSILAPEFDNASDIYVGLTTLLDEAIADLSIASSSDIGSEDFVYGGDVSKWLKFANSLKLRVLLRTSEAKPNGTAIKALVANSSFIESASDVAAVPFQDKAGAYNPMYALFERGVGDFYFASNATLNKLDELSDPRGTAFYSVATSGPFLGQLRGIEQGAVDRDVPFTDPAANYSGSSSMAYSADNAVILMSDWEVWFLRAEAAARYGTADDDATAFANAVTNNFNYLGVSGADAYVSSLNYSGNLDQKLNLIGVQKWISMNGTQEDEGWIEARRFDRPGNRIFTGGIFQNPPNSVLPAGTFPATWLYPASERSLNANAPAQRSITDRIYWDN